MLRAKSIRRVDCRDKHGAANWPHLGDRSKQAKSLMFSAFGHHGHLGLLPKRSQMVQFFIQPVHTLSNSRLGEQLQPLVALLLLIDARPWRSDSMCAIDC